MINILIKFHTKRQDDQGRVKGRYLSRVWQNSQNLVFIFLLLVYEESPIIFACIFNRELMSFYYLSSSIKGSCIYLILFLYGELRSSNYNNVVLYIYYLILYCFINQIFKQIQPFVLKFILISTSVSNKYLIYILFLLI